MFSFLGRPRGAVALASAASAIAIVASISPASAQEQQHTYNIPAQSLSSSLLEFSRQSDLRVMADPSVVNGRQAPALQGEFTVSAGLDRLLAGSGLTYSTTPSGAILVQDSASPTRLGDASGAAPSDDAYAEILVIGRHTTNSDIRRSEDDPLPYVVFGAEDIARSNATDLDDFLRTRLPMNATNRSSFAASNGDVGVSEGRIDLRGLGSSQTLVLVNGRRLAGVTYGTLRQGSITGIPLSAIERIEVLPSSAGAIYGGSAVGGVINVILKHDYSGTDVTAGYGNTFDGATGDYRLDLSTGFSSGGTQVMLSGSRSHTAALNVNDRANDILRARRAYNQALILGDTFPLIAGTANICGVTASTCNGTLLTLDDGTPLNSAYTFVPYGYAGPVATGDGGHALIANAGHYNLAAIPTDADLNSERDVDVLQASIRHQLTSDIDLYAEGYWERTEQNAVTNAYSVTGVLAANDPNNPFQQAIRVRLPLPDIVQSNGLRSTDLRLLAGGIVKLPFNWTASLEHTFDVTHLENTNENQPLLSTIFSGGAVYGTRDVFAFRPDLSAFSNDHSPDATLGPIDSTLNDTALRLAGAIFSLPGGPIQLTGSLERRTEEADQNFQVNYDNTTGVPTYFLTPARHQSTDSAYLEARLPIIGDENGIPFVHNLDLQASVRNDDYAVTGTISQFALAAPDSPHAPTVYRQNEFSSTDYLLALRYQPIEGVTLRASQQTGFLPPNMQQLTTTVFQRTPAQIGSPTDPERGNTTLTGNSMGLIDLLTGGNPDLEPETSEARSFGIIWEPTFLRRLRFSADLSDIRKSGEIGGTASLQAMLNNPAIYGSRITRGANLPGDPVGWSGPVIAVDQTLGNFKESRFRAWDFQADYTRDIGSFGSIHAYAIATHLEEASHQTLAGQPLVDTVGFNSSPMEWRGNFGADWTFGPLQVAWDAQYYDGFNVCAPTDSVGTCATTQTQVGMSHFPSQIFHDLSVSYTFDEYVPQALAGTQVRFGIQNLFDEAPIYPSTGVATSPYPGYVDPRLRRFTLSVTHHFN